MQTPALSRRRVLGLLVAGLIALATWFLQGQGISVGGDDDQARPAPTSSATPSYDAGAASPGEPGPGDRDPESGLRWVALDELPPEAEQTIELIDAGGPFPYDRDGVTFENREDLLPDHPVGYYREYTVPTPGSPDRGARRVVTGDPGEYYWTEDHYRSFERVLR